MQKKSNVLIAVSCLCLFSSLLSSCNNKLTQSSSVLSEIDSQDEYIEVGLTFGNGEGSSPLINNFYEFYTGIKAKTESGSNQSVEVYLGQRHLSHEFLEYCNSDKDQLLELKLYRNIYIDGYRNVYDVKEIYSFINITEYFFDIEFNMLYYKKMPFNDNITADDLIKSKGRIQYTFTISPVEDEPLRIYCKSSDGIIPAYSENEIRSYYYSQIKFNVDENKNITFSKDK